MEQESVKEKKQSKQQEQDDEELHRSFHLLHSCLFLFREATPGQILNCDPQHLPGHEREQHPHVACRRYRNQIFSIQAACIHTDIQTYRHTCMHAYVYTCIAIHTHIHYI